MVIIFLSTHCAQGRPIQGIIWRRDVTKYVPGRSKTKQISSPNQRDVTNKIPLLDWEQKSYTGTLGKSCVHYE